MIRNLYFYKEIGNFLKEKDIIKKTLWVETFAKPINFKTFIDI